jgi:hypothetical protein
MCGKQLSSTPPVIKVKLMLGEVYHVASAEKDRAGPCCICDWKKGTYRGDIHQRCMAQVVLTNSKHLQ